MGRAIGKDITTSVAVSTKGCIVWSMALITADDTSTLVIKDGGSGGTTVYTLSGKTTADGDTTLTQAFPNGLTCTDGLYVTLTGTGSSGSITYEIIG